MDADELSARSLDGEELRDWAAADAEVREDAWAESAPPFDLTGRSETSETKFIEDEVQRHAWRLRRHHVRVGRANLAWMLDFDQAVHEDRDHRLSLYDWESVDGLYEVGADCEDIALGRELDQRDPTFWPDLRRLGPSPAMVRRANDLLERQGHLGVQRTGGPILTLPARRRTCARQRASRGSAPRTRGSRRVTSRSAGGGSSGDDPGGDSSEPGLARQPLSGKRQAVAHA